jgi:hypothetical protein
VILSTFKFIFFIAPSTLLVNLLTSSATTANPRPCSPTLAASIAAFKDKILVWEKKCP